MASTWGKSFVVTATPAKSPGDHVRVIAGRANVNIWLSNGSATNLLRMGDFFDTDIVPGDSFMLRADKPIQVERELLEHLIQVQGDSGYRCSGSYWNSQFRCSDFVS